MKNTSLFLILLLFLKISFAQDITGSLEGKVFDSTGTPLSGVNILLGSENLQGTRGTSTDERGYFQIIALPVGVYQVQITMVGFKKTVYTDIHILLGSTTSLGTIVLQQQSIETEEIIISGNKTLIDPTSTEYGGTLRSKDFENLPLDRDYKSIVALLPQANSSYLGDQVNFAGSHWF